MCESALLIGGGHWDKVYSALKSSIHVGERKSLVRLSKGQEVAVLAINGTEIVMDAQRRHKLAPTPLSALGRALMGALLMCVYRKADESLQLTFMGDGPLKNMQVIAESGGYVKGRVGNPGLQLPLRPDGRVDVGGAVGSLAVVRTHPLATQPYTGNVEIVSGEVAEDLTHYLAQSEQTNSAMALGVQIEGGTGSVAAAGGYLIQVLPSASDETLKVLEENIRMLPNVSDFLAMGMGLDQLVEVLLDGIGVDDESRGYMTASYGPCEKVGLQERMKTAVAALGGPEVERILKEEGKVEVSCHFCSETYEFGEAEVRKLLEQGAEELARNEAAAREAGISCDADVLPPGETREWREAKIQEVSEKCGGDVIGYFSDGGPGREELEKEYFEGLQRRIWEREKEVSVLDKELAELDRAVPDDFVENFEDLEAEAARGAGLKMEELSEEERVLVKEFDDRIGLTKTEEEKLAAALEEAAARLGRKGAGGENQYWPKEPPLLEEDIEGLRSEVAKDKEDFAAAVVEGRRPRRRLPYPVVGVAGKTEKDLKPDLRLEPPELGSVEDGTQVVSTEAFEGIDWSAAETSYGRAGPPKLIEGGLIEGSTEDSWWNGGIPADVLNTLAQEALVEVADEVAAKIGALSPAEQRALREELTVERRKILEGSGEDADELAQLIEEAQLGPPGEVGEWAALGALSAEFARLERELGGGGGSDGEAERAAEMAAAGGLDEVRRQAIDIVREIRELDAAEATAAGKVGPDDLQPLFWNPKAGSSKGEAGET